MSTEETRKQFEAWARQHRHRIVLDKWEEPTEYKFVVTNIAWNAWQAAVAAEREACAKVCEFEQQDRSECPEMAQYCADAIRARSENGGGE